MKYAKNLLSSALLAVCLGCASTVAPQAPKDSVASFDGNAQNSGFIGFDSAGNGILTVHGYQRYFDLVGSYGFLFSPKLDCYRNDDLQKTSTNTYLIDAQHLTYFATMNRWRKEGK